MTTASCKEQYPEHWDILYSTLKETFEDPEYIAFLEENGTLEFSKWYGSEVSTQQNRNIEAMLQEYKDLYH